jgi:hypothetical protein
MCCSIDLIEMKVTFAVGPAEKVRLVTLPLSSIFTVLYSGGTEVAVAGCQKVEPGR